MASAKIDYTPRNVTTDASGNVRVRNKVVAYHNPAKMVRGGSFFTPKGGVEQVEEAAEAAVETEAVEA